TSTRLAFSKADALSLVEIASHAFACIESVQRYDRKAMEAASIERRRVALDLHDTAIQPYIGLAHGLAALRRKCPADHPLAQDLDNLAQMTTQVITDLRSYAR